MEIIQIKLSGNKIELYFSLGQKMIVGIITGLMENSRLVLIYNLMTNDIRSVCKVDNVSYYKVFLREKLINIF